MITDDKDHFFVDMNRKKEICSSLDASMRALGTNKEGMFEELSQLKKVIEVPYKAIKELPPNIYKLFLL